MAASETLLLFGDQAGDITSATRELFRRSKHSLNLQSFIQQSQGVVHEEYRKYRGQDAVPTELLAIRSFLELASKESAVLHPATRTLLFTFVQIGELIHLAENGIIYPSSSPKVLASCTGLLSAVVALTSQSVPDILNCSKATITLALRLGLAAAQRSASIQQCASQEAWAVAIAGVASEQCLEAVKEFNEDNTLPAFKSAYISATISDASITVSGPPSTLTLLFAQRQEFRAARSTHLPLTAAFHAQHLCLPDVTSLLDINEPILDRRIPQGGPSIISPSTGQPISSDTVRGLYAQVIEEIFQNPINWPECKKSVISTLRPGALVTLLPMGPNNTENVVQSLRQHGFPVVVSNPDEDLDSAKSAENSNSIAIIGMSGRFPGSASLDELWHVLEKGASLDRPVPAERHADGFHACLIDEPGAFDCRMFNMSPREALQTDPGQRLLLMAAYEALELAGFNPAMLRRGPLKRVGTFIGQTVDNTEIADQAVDINYVTGNIRATTAGRLNYHFKWDGPSVTLDTACSSSLFAIETACRRLIANDCDMALAGGTNILAGSSAFIGLAKGSFLTSTGPCKTFDHDADGYCRADGVGCLVLKRVVDALADGDNILGLIRGAATNHSSQATSITHPHCETQKELFREVLGRAGLDADDIDYVEAHGTATQAGDAIEFESVASVLATQRSRPLQIGGLKPNIGHSEAAAGVASVIKSIMMFEKNLIPPHVGIQGRVNENFNMRRGSIRIPDQPITFTPGRGREKRRILVNSFSAVGGNTSVVLEDPPEAPITATDPRTAFPVVLSAKTETSLARNIQNLAQYLIRYPQIPLSHVSYTTTARRPTHHPLRKAFVTQDTARLVKLLKDATKSSTSKPRAKPSVGFTFTGQGSLFSGMASKLFRECQCFQNKILECHSITTSLGFPSWLDLVTEESADLAQAHITQTNLATVSVEVAMAFMWMSWSLRPSVCVGHSLGEYAALCVAGALSLHDMLYLVGKRAQLLDQVCQARTHSMLAMRCSVSEAEAHLQAVGMGDYDVTCINGPDSTVIGGSSDALAAAAAKIKSKGIACKLLPVDYAFHSRQMDSLLPEFRSEAASVHVCPPRIPVASTVTGSIISPGNSTLLDSDFFCQQTRQPVQFCEAVKSCAAAGLADHDTIWLEMGPGRVLLDLLKPALGPVAPASALQLVPSIQKNQDSWTTVSKALASAYEAGLKVDWLAYHEQYKHCLRIVRLPTYAFDTKNYWLEPKEKESKSPASALREYDGFSTTCLHRVESETIHPGVSASVTFISNLADPKLQSFATGHLICGKALVPSSVYAEMALSAASYVHDEVCKAQGAETPIMSISKMHIFKPLIALPNVKTQSVRVACTMESPTAPVEFVLSSQDPATKEWAAHGRCSVHFSDGHNTNSEWHRNSYLVKDRWRHIASGGAAERLSQKLAYRLFRNIVSYKKSFEGLREVFLDDENFEVAARIKLNEADPSFQGTYPPQWIDCMGQAGGLALNAMPKTEGTVFLSSGWSAMEVFTQLSHRTSYYAHARMMEVKKNEFEGDVYVFDDERLVAVCRGLWFQRMRKATLQAILGVTSPSRLVSADTCVPLSDQQQATSPATTSELCALDTGLMNRIQDIISEEAGLDAGDLSEETNLADIGIDSILTISILNRLRALIPMDLPSSLFVTHPTLKDLQRFFGSVGTSSSLKSHQASPVPVISAPARPSPVSRSPDPTNTGEDVVTQVLRCMVEQAGLESGELSGDADFCDLGIDSILSISILVEIRRTTGLDLPSSLFMTCPTVSSLKEFIHEKLGQSSYLASGKSSSAAVSPLPTPTTSRSATPNTEDGVESHTSTSILLQGRPAPSQPAVFLLPDGSGSALSYLELQPLGGPPVYALDSPFLKCPTEYTQQFPFQRVASIYIDEIRRVQPSGPYMIGGWSMGGIFAFEVARQLLESGEDVTALLLIDAPCPRTIPPLPEATMTVLEEAGVFSGLDKSKKGISEATRLHAVACVRCLGHFEPQPMRPSGRLGHVSVIWARDGVLDEVGEDAREKAERGLMTGSEREAARAAKDWLMGKRDYGPAGWEELIGKEISCEVVAGNHFSMMKSPFIHAVSDVVKRVVAKVIAR